MPVQLVVVRPFFKYNKGDVIVNAAEIDRILASDHKTFVVQVGMAGRLEG